MSSYPHELERNVVLRDQHAVTIRPIRPSDAELEQEFVQGLSAQTRYFRFLDSVRGLTPRMLQHFTDIDYDRHMALIALTEINSRPVQIGVGRYVVTADEKDGEFALVIADDWQRRGLGRILLESLIDVARSRGLRALYGDVLASNGAMLGFVAKLGFRVEPSPDDPTLLRARLELAGNA